MLLTEAIEKLCLATRANGCSARTVSNYHEKLGHLLRFLGDVEVEQITVDDLRRYIVSLMDRCEIFTDHPICEKKQRRLSPYTIKTYVRHIKRLFSWLEEEGHIAVNPADRIETPRATQRHPKAISQDDFLAILATTEGESNIDKRDRAAILLLADSGCRAGGLCHLRLDDVKLDRCEAEVCEKMGKESRDIMFTETTAQAIRDWLEVRPTHKGDWLFVSLGRGDRLKTNGFGQMLGRRAEQAGVTGPHNPHAFRHAFAIAYLMNGGDLASLADILGHSNVEITRKYYARFTMGHLRKKHARHSPVAQLFGGDNNDKQDTSLSGCYTTSLPVDKARQ